MELSKLIKKYRKVTLDELQKKSELSKGFLSRIENGDYDKGNVSLGTIIKLADGLGIKALDILDELSITDSKSPSSLNIYLRDKYNIVDDIDVETIKNVISKFRK